MSYRKRFFWFTMLISSICILLYGLNDKLTALAYPPEYANISSISGFEFLEDYEYKIKEVRGLSEKEIMKIQKEESNSSSEIDSYKYISTNELDIDSMEAIDMRHLVDGDSAIWIDYKGKYSGEGLKESGILGAEEEVTDIVTKIGKISIYATNQEPYFRVGNLGASIGIGTNNIVIPSKIYELTPEEISDVSVYSYIRHIDTSYIEATIIIKRDEISGDEISADLPHEISLQELDLQEKFKGVIKESGDSSTLEIVKNYVFTIPFDILLNKEEGLIEYREEGNNAVIEVDIPLRFQAKVNHK